MAKTTFSSGVIVTSAWLNGARNIVFDGQDVDWHYNPLGLDSLVTKGPNGLDTRYVTLGTDQPSLSTSGIYLTGQPISGNKVATGQWTFGFDPVENPQQIQNYNNAPKSYLTNLKYDNANGIPNPSQAQKFAALEDSDIITKKVLYDIIMSIPVIDGGTY